jgi:predicted ATPase/transcriptional regulator with XRE-family HTH domain
MDDPLTFGPWLKQHRRRLGLTQAELGGLIGYSSETLRKVEADELRPSRQLAEKLAQALEIPPEQQQVFVRFAREVAGAEAPAVPVPAAAAMPPTPPTIQRPPLPRDPLIGREAEVAGLCALLLRPGVGLVTLVGPGGVGKTRLVLQVAEGLRDYFRDGVVWVPLAATSDPAGVVPAIARALGLRETGKQAALAQLTAALADRQILLLLDNFEQVAEAAPEVGRLLEATPGLKVLVTSRLVLRLRGEHAFEVPPLALPEALTGGAPAAHDAQAEASQIAAAAAVRLFVARAQAADAGFGLGAINAPVVAALCQRLDGLPLAIELVAARTRTLTPQDMLARLQNQLQWPTRGARDLPTRQQTLRATMDWSFGLLAEGERILFRRLAVFVGGFTPQAAQQVANADEALGPDVLEVLEGLLDHHLLQAQEASAGPRRFGCLRLVREYALERLEASGEAPDCRRRHAEYFAVLAESAEPELIGPGQAAGLDRLAAEHDNLRAALEWSLAEEEVELGLRVAGAVWRFWDVRGYWQEGRRWLEALLARSSGRTATCAKALNAAGILAVGQGDYAAACAHHERDLAIERTLGDKLGIARALNGLGNVAWNQSDYGAARAYHEEALAWRRAAEDQAGIAASLHNLGNVAWYQRDFAAAHAFLEESLALLRAQGDTQNIARTLNSLGVVAFALDDLPTARRFYEESLAVRRELGDRRGIAGSLNNLGRVAWAQGDFAGAHAMHIESLAIVRDLGDSRAISMSLYNLGLTLLEQGDLANARRLSTESLAMRQVLGHKQEIVEGLLVIAAVSAQLGDWDRAAQLLGASTAHLEAIGAAFVINERRLQQRVAAAAQAVLGSSQYEACWVQGNALTLEEAIGEALALAE